MNQRSISQRTAVFAFLALLGAGSAAAHTPPWLSQEPRPAQQGDPAARPAPRVGEAPRGPQQVTGQIQLARCRELIGLDLLPSNAASAQRGAEEEALGSVSDLVVDVDGGTVLGAVIASAARGGEGSIKRLVPQADLQFRPVVSPEGDEPRAAEFELRTTLDRARFEALPAFDPAQLGRGVRALEAGSGERGRAAPPRQGEPREGQRPSGSGRDGERRGGDGSDSSLQEPVRSGGAGQRAPLPTDPVPPAAADGLESATLVSKLHGQDVRSSQARGQQGDVLGTIDSLAIDPVAGRLHYVLLSSSSVVGVRGNQVPVPARLLDSGAEPEGRAGTESEGWQLPLSPAQFEAAPRIDQESDQNLENPAFRLRVDEYYRQFAGRDARRGAVAPQ